MPGGAGTPGGYQSDWGGSTSTSGGRIGFFEGGGMTNEDLAAIDAHAKTVENIVSPGGSQQDYENRYNQMVRSHGGTPTNQRIRGDGWTPGAGNRYIQQKGRRNTVGGIKGAGNWQQFLSKIDPRNWNLSDEGTGNLLQTVTNMPKYWDVPPSLRGKIPIAHGFANIKDLQTAKKSGFKNIRPQSKFPPTTDAIEAATKALVKGNLKDAWTKLGQTKGAFTATGPTEKAAFLGGQKYAKPGSSITRGFGKLGPAENVVSGYIDPKFGYVDRGMTGNRQFRGDTGAINKALGLGPKSAQVAGKPIAQSLLNKLGARVLPGANIGLGIASAVEHAKAGDYGQALMAGISAIPGPVGYAGLAGELGLGALSNLSLGDPNAPENTLVMNRGGRVYPYSLGGLAYLLYGGLV